MKKVKILKDEENEIPAEIFEQAIIDLAKGFKALTDSRLSKRAIVLLVRDAAGPSKVTASQVAWVLDAAAELERTYIKKRN